MIYQINNKAQALGIADYSVDNFPSVFETLYDENVEFNVNTVGDTGACLTNRGWQRDTAAVSVSTSLFKSIYCLGTYQMLAKLVPLLYYPINEPILV